MTPAPANRRVGPPRHPLDTVAPVPSPPRAPPRVLHPPSLSKALAALRAIAGAALVIGASAAFAWVARRHVTTSPRFAIARIDVTGSERRAAEAIAAECGLATGANIFAVDLDSARTKLLADPWIADAVLARRLPGTVLVRVTERKAAALVAVGDLLVASADGEPFKRFEPGDPVDLPLVTGLSAEGLAQDRTGAGRTLRAAIDLAAEYERTAMAKRSPLQEVHATPEGAFTLVVGRGAVELALGHPPFRRKLDQATRVVAELDRRGGRPEAILLDNDTRPERVVVRLR